MSSVTNSGTNYYYCAAPGCTSDYRKRGRYGKCSMSSFMHFRRKRKLNLREESGLNFFVRYKLRFFEESEILFFAFYGWEATTEHPFPELFEYNNFKESRKVTVQNYFMFHLKIKVHFARINVSEWSSFFSTFSHGSLGCKIILNFKTNKVLDEWTINYTTIYNGIITFL